MSLQEAQCIVHANETCGYLNAQCSTFSINDIDILDGQRLDMSDYIYCLVPYSIALPMIVMSCYSRENLGSRAGGVNLSTIYIFLLISFVLRCLWLLSRGLGFWDIETRVVQTTTCSMCLACTWNIIPHLFNRLAVLSYFTAYTCVCKIWLDVWAKSESLSGKNMSFEDANKRLRNNTSQGKGKISSSIFTDAITDDDGGDFDGGTNTNSMVEENKTFSSVSPNSSSMEDAPAIRICGCNITLFIFILNIWMYVKSICLLNINN